MHRANTTAGHALHDLESRWVLEENKGLSPYLWPVPSNESSASRLVFRNKILHDLNSGSRLKYARLVGGCFER